MQHLTNWQRDEKLLVVKTKTNNRPWRGKLVKSAESQFEVTLELELDQKDCSVVVIPWHAVEYVRVHQTRQ